MWHMGRMGVSERERGVSEREGGVSEREGGALSERERGWVRERGVG